MDILDYARSMSNRPFSEEDLTDLDVALLTELSYLVFTGLISSSLSLDKGVSLAQVREGYQKKAKRPSYELKLAYDTRLSILDELASSQRFGEILAFAYVDELDRAKEMQFAAVTFLVAGRLLGVFRGTDSSLVGWKEDFNMAYMKVLPSQKAAKLYLNRLLSQHKLPLLVAGHSKGGNLALYATSQNPSQQIERVYLFDAPGLQPAALDPQGYGAISPKVKSFRPRMSLVGTLYDEPVAPLIVSSKGVSLLQHLMLLWEVDAQKSSFLLASSDSYLSQRADRLSAYYLEHSDRKTNRLSINWLYRLLDSLRGDASWGLKFKRLGHLLGRTSLQEVKALYQALVLLFSAFRLSGQDYLSPAVKNRGRRLFGQFFYLPENLASYSKWLSLVVILALSAFIFVLAQDAHLNLLIFSFLYLLALFLAGVLSFYNWWHNARRQTLSYLPGMYGFFVLIYQLLNVQRFSQVLPGSLWYLLSFWTLYLFYQTYRVRKYVPTLSKILLRAGLVGLVFLGVAYHFPGVLEFLASKALVLLLFYKLLLCLVISYNQWRKK